MHERFSTSLGDTCGGPAAQHLVLNAESFMHHVNVEVAPTARRNAFGAAIDIRPVGFGIASSEGCMMAGSNARMPFPNGPVQDNNLHVFGKEALVRRPRIQGRAAALPWMEG
jgi:hypothetical protein